MRRRSTGWIGGGKSTFPRAAWRWATRTGPTSTDATLLAPGRTSQPGARRRLLRFEANDAVPGGRRVLLVAPEEIEVELRGTVVSAQDVARLAEAFRGLRAPALDEILQRALEAPQRRLRQRRFLAFTPQQLVQRHRLAAPHHADASQRTHQEAAIGARQGLAAQQRHGPPGFVEAFQP